MTKKTFKDFGRNTPQAFGVLAVLAVVIAILCELFLFNYKWLGSLTAKPLDLQPELLSGAVLSGEEISFTEDSAVLSFPEVNEKLNYLYFCPGENPKEIEVSEDAGNQAVISLRGVDEANSEGLSVPQRTVLQGVARSQYLRLHFSGEVRNLKITVNGMNGKTMPLSSVALNAKVPLLFSWQRMFVVALLLFALFLLRPGSFAYRYQTNLKSRKQLAVVAVLVILQSLFLLNAVHWSPKSIHYGEVLNHHHQYHKLVQSFLEGRLDITNGDVSKELLEMENPYDTYARVAKDVEFRWDHAYYEGNYYVYFGVVPALVYYLPYHLLTGGNMLPNYVVVYLNLVLIMICILYVLWQMIKKWFPNTPFLIYLLMSVVFSSAACISYGVYKPDFYFVPISTGLMFGLFGLGLWLSAEQETENGTRLCSVRLGAGSLLVALTAGCRPQMLLVAFLGVVLFWKAAFSKRLLFSKQGWKQTLSVCLPFVVVGVALMWYNFARFGSPFDFGANYNLTTNDMTHRGMVWGRTGLGLFSYLLQPPLIDAIFPFFHDFDAHTVYQGLTLTEKMLGGVLWLYPVLWLGIYGLCKKKLFSDRGIYRLLLASVVISGVVVVMDTQMAGLLTRYFADFVWFLMLAAAMTVFALYERYPYTGEGQRVVSRIVVCLCACTLTAAFLTVFARSEDSIMGCNPALYYSLQHLIAFWM